MFKKTKVEATALDKAIESVFTEMNGFTADAPEYSTMVDQLKKLYELKQIDKPERISKDAWAAIIGNLAGIVAILSFEQTHSIGTKALSFVMKSKP